MKVLIVGLGSISKKHISALKNIDSTVEIYALRSIKGSSQYLNIKNIYCLKEIQFLKLDFVIISTPTANHAKDIEKLTKLNIPLFIEKPLFESLNYSDIVTQVLNTKIKTYVACNLRFLECLNFVKNNVLTNNLIINEVNVYCGSYLPDWRPNTDFRENYSANAKMGGGVHIDLIHEIDYAYWLFGSPLKITKLLKSNSSLKIDSIDYAHFNFEYNNFNTSITLNYFRRTPKRYLEILFDKYTIYVDLLTNKVFKNDEVIFEGKQKIIDTYENQMRYFIKNIKKPTFNNIKEAYTVLKLVLN